MLKPLLLLVDDEPAVLDALAAFLRPALEEAFRVESFERPGDVLANMAAWRAGGGAIALALVDQKMPEMSGTDLLVHLRAEATTDPSHPAAHMRSALLTGYGGLDAAVRAKNEAGVDRYLEKPWRDAELEGVCRELLREHLVSSGRAVHHVFREAWGRDELREHLRLRYEIYRSTEGLKNVLPSDGSGLDIDAYDGVATLFNLFVVDLDDERAVGTMRVVGREGPGCRGTLDALVEAHPALQQRLHAERDEALPLLAYLVDREAVEALLRTIRDRGERVVEPGRFTLHPRHRSHAAGVALLPLAVQMIEGATSFFFFVFRFEHAVLACAPEHVRFYRPVGFREVEGTSAILQPALGAVKACLHGFHEAVPSAVHPRILSRARRIEATGGTCQCPTFPACLGGPYERASFRETDLFCPAAATDLLTTRKRVLRSPDLGR